MLSLLLVAAATTPDLSPWLAPLATSVLVAILGGWFMLRGKFADNNARRGDMQPPSWTDVYARLDAQDKKIRLMVGIVASAADQWPADTPGPTFDQETLELLADLDDTLVPAKWRRLRPHRPATQ